MIAGPVIPRTRDGLWDAIEQNLDRIEVGLTVVHRDLLLESDCRVEALCRDATGHPVLMFLAMAGEDRELIATVIEARSWMQENAVLLARVLPLRGLRYELPVRVMLIGFDLSWSLVARLRNLSVDGLEGYQIRTFTVCGRCTADVVPLVGEAATGAENAFTPPRGLAGAEQRELCAYFLDVMRRLDPALRAAGDRYGRRLSFEGCLLAELRLRDDVLAVHVPAGVGDRGEPGEVLELAVRTDCNEALDRVMRLYLRALGHAPQATRAPDVTPEPPLAGSGDQQEEEDLSLAPLRRTTEQAQLTHEEYLALGGSLPEVD